MPSASLLEHSLRQGASVVATLLRGGVPIDCVAWSYSSDDDKWHLVIATPLAETEGSGQAFARIRALITADPWLNQNIGRVVIVNPQRPDVQPFLHLAQTQSGQEF